MIKAICIDLDDTLVLTEAACFEMENQVLIEMGRATMAREVHVNTWGKPLFEAIINRSPGIDVEAFRKAYAPVFASYVESGKLDSIRPENYDALDEIIRDGKQLYVLTSRTHDELYHLLKPDHFLAQRVKTFYYRDNMRFHKPDPRAFDGLLKDNQLLPAEVVYVGDSIGDAAAANQAGLHFIAYMESGLRSKADFAHLMVDAFIDNFSDLKSAVERLEKKLAQP